MSPTNDTESLARPARVHVLINPASGADQAVLAILARTFAEAGITWTCDVLQPDDDVGALIDAALARDERPDWIAASGGDGTVSLAAAAMAGCGVPLAPLPGGTGNVVAQELGLALDYERAARALFLGPVELRELDLVEVGGVACILRAGLGADARLMASADRAAKDRLGWAAYLGAAIEQISTDEVTRLEVEVDGETFEADVLTALVMNTSRLGRGGAVLSQAVRPDDGVLDLLLIRRGSVAAVLQVLRSIMDRTTPLPRAQGAPGDRNLSVEHIPARRVTITPRDEIALQIDGDVRPALPAGCRLEYGIRDERVLMVAPVL